jgi:predicted nucleic acid-binding protein
VLYILDTNILSDVFRYGLSKPQGRRVEAEPHENIRITTITFEEMLEGRLMELRKDPSKVKNLEPLNLRYSLLQHTFSELSRYYPPLPFDVSAEAVYRLIPLHVRKSAAHDCRIAAIQLSLGKDYTLISRDKDFDTIKKAMPELQLEDWSITLPT